MGIYSNTVSFVQYIVTGDLPLNERFEWLSSAISGRKFKSIEDSADEQSEGWTSTDTPDEPSFDSPSDFWRDRYLFFSYRRDQRRIPAAILKSYISRAEEDYLSKRPGLKRPPKQQREEIKERVKLQLFGRTLPSPSTVDIVWHLDNGLLTLLSSSSKTMERVEELFSKSFENIRPRLIYPYLRALGVLDEGERELLASFNQSPSDSVVDEIQSNRWLGEDFLLWLLHDGLEGGSFSVSRPGHYDHGTPFSAWIDDRIQFHGGGSGGPQKVSVSGSQDRYLEARSALKSGKVINSAAIHIEKDELQWSFVLNAELFTFSSFKSPPVKIEKEGVEEFSERESAFYERLYLLETGLQMFDSLLKDFLKIRLSESWAERRATIDEWITREGQDN